MRLLRSRFSSIEKRVKMRIWGLCFKAITSSSLRLNNKFQSDLFPKWIFKWPVSSGSTWVNCSLRRFKWNYAHTSWSGLYSTIRPCVPPKTTLTLFCPRVQSRRQRSTAIRSSTSKAGATSIWPASCCKRRNHHPSSIGKFERSPLTVARIEFVPRIFRHSRVSRNPNLQWPPFDRVYFIEKFQRELL